MVLTHPGLVRIAAHPNDEGYMRIRLTCDDGKRRSYLVHKLVAQAFLPPPTEEQRYVCHKNSCRTDASAHNLYWGTHADNHRDKKERGTIRHVNRKLSKLDVRRIRRSKSSAAVIARREGLSISHVRDIRNGRRHKRRRPACFCWTDGDACSIHGGGG